MKTLSRSLILVGLGVRALWAVDVDGTGIRVVNWPNPMVASPLAVTGSFYQDVQPVSGPIVTQGVSVTASAGVGVSTGAAVTAGLTNYVTYVEIEMYAAGLRLGLAGPVTCTSSNLPGNPSFTMDTAQSLGVVIARPYMFQSPLKSIDPSQPTTVSCPSTAGLIWRINMFYYQN